MAKSKSKSRDLALPVPHPIVVSEVCSECGLAWSLHPENATLADCVRLLKTRHFPLCTLPHYPYCNRPHYPNYPTVWYTNSGSGTSPFIVNATDNTNTHTVRLGTVDVQSSYTRALPSATA